MSDKIVYLNGAPPTPIDGPPGIIFVRTQRAKVDIDVTAFVANRQFNTPP